MLIVKFQTQKKKNKKYIKKKKNQYIFAYTLEEMIVHLSYIVKKDCICVNWMHGALSKYENDWERIV